MMRRLLSILALAAAFGLAGTPSNRAEATVLTGPHGLGAAVDDLRLAEPAHCRPGRRHHRARPYDGCRKVQRRAPAIVRPSPPVRDFVPPMRESGFGSLHEW
jgi:hypothetical protein